MILLVLISFFHYFSPKSSINLTETLEGQWNITSYLMDETGKEHYQDRIYYSLDLKRIQSNQDLYGFFYTFVDGYKNENDISVRFIKNKISDFIYHISISTSDVSTFVDCAILNVSSINDGVLMASGEVLPNLYFNYDYFQFSLTLSHPNYAELVILDVTKENIDVYRIVKLEIQKFYYRWHYITFFLTAVYIFVKFIYQSKK